MANTKQAKKRAIQSEKHRINNKWQLTRMRTNLKKVVSAITDAKKEDAESAFRLSISSIDKLVSKGILHKNKAARHKKRLSSQIKALA